MTISILHYGTTYSASFPSDDVTLDPIVRAFFNLLVSAGYSQKGIAALFKDGDPNGWDSAWPVPEQAKK
jgi:predicted component of type VI protein secretion system